MTEEEAKKKQCCGPLLLAAAQAAIEFRRAGQAVPAQLNPNCMASACMAWRWLPNPKINQIAENYSELEMQTPTSGYCGLAGKP